LFAHSIKASVLAAIGVTIYFASSENAEAWTPCMPICDFACTAPSAISMSMQVLSSHLELSKELMSNIEEISSLSKSIVDRNGTISAQETLNNTSRITALDGVSSKLTLALQLNGVEKEYQTNNHITQLDKLSLNGKKENDAREKLNAISKLDTDSLLNSLAASETIKANSKLMDDFLIASDQFQMENSGYLTSDEFREKSGLLSDLSHDFPNPFVTEVVDMDFYMDYQKQITLLYNHQGGLPENINEATRRVRSRLIINSLNLDILQNASFQSDGSIESLTMQTNATVSRAKAESYRRLMYDKQALTSLEKQTKGSLLLTNVIVKSQKNLLLQEILKTKKQKNMLIALSMLGR
jgi:uncharacterized protein (UPF0333 family)